MSYDFRKQASGPTLNTFLRKAEEEFCSAIAKVINDRVGRYVKAKVHTGSSTTFVTFEGEDNSDLPIDGHVYIITTDNFGVKYGIESKGYMSYEEEKTTKVGVLTPEMVAQLVIDAVIRP